MKFPKLRSAYLDLVRSESGELWAELDHPDEAAATWDVFMPSGILVGSVTTPAGCDLLHADRTDILCRFKDSDDVETVRLYRLAAQ